MNQVKLKTFAAAGILALLGYVGNTPALPLSYNIDFIFGSIFGLIALRLLGARWGVTVALIAAGRTYLLWNNPYGVIIFTGEAIWIGIALKRGRHNLLLLDGCYWLALGMPLALLFHGGALKLGLSETLVIALKQGVNGVTNTLLATVILDHTPLRRWLSGAESDPPQPYAAGLFNLAAASMMLPALALILLANHRENKRIETLVSQEMATEAHESQVILKSWLVQHLNAIRLVAELPVTPTAQLQENLNHTRALLPDFNTLFIGDAAGTTIAFSPTVNERRESTIGINFADRSWFKELSGTLRPVISDVFQGRGGVFSPIFTMSVPVVRDGRISRFGLGSIDLERLRQLFNPSCDQRELIATIIDRNSRVVISSNKTRKPLDTLAYSGATQGGLTPEVSLRTPALKEFATNIRRKEADCYVLRQPVPDTPWTLLLEYPVEPLQTYAHETTAYNLELLAFFFAAMLGAATLVSRSLTRPLAALAVVSRDIPQRIDRDEEIPWPVAPTRELTSLTANFRLTAVALRERIEQARQANSRLEEQVQLRTAELALSETRFRTLFHDHSALFLLIDPVSGIIVDANDSAARFYGRSIPELRALNIDAINILPSAEVTALTGMARNNERNSFIFPHKLHDGALRLVEVHSSPVTVNGESLLFSIIHDVTDRESAAQRVRDSEEQLRSLFTLAAVGIARMKPTGEFMEVNDHLCTLLGYPRSELLTMTFQGLTHPEDLATSISTVTELLSGKIATFSLEKRYIQRSGTIIWGHVTAALSHHEEPTAGYIVVIVEDITARKGLEQTHQEDEARLRSSQTRLSTIFRTSPDVIAISQRTTGRFLEVNEAFERVIGYRREEALGRTALELGTWGSPELRVRMLTALKDQTRLENYETCFRRKSGEIFPVLLSLEQMELDGVACLIFSARDITEQGQIREELLQSRNVAQAANRAKSQFLANMSHEIRTPMNGVLGMAQLLALTELTDEQQAYVAALKESGKNLLTLISDILDLSKIEAGKVELEESDFDLRLEVQGAVNLLALQAREKGLKLLAPVDLQLPYTLRGDAGRLRQIMINLMGNALKFTTQGAVTLEIRKEREDDRTVTLRFLIIDTGIGIPTEKLEAIFAPFTQADGSTTRSYGGTGLGLTISRQLAELMGGSIGVESVPGKGSTFWFTAVLEKQTVIPCTPSPPRKDSSVPSTDGGRLEEGRPGGGVTRLLLVEDEPVNQMVISVTLEKFGFLVDLATNGREALIALENNDYDLVLMDCMMPVLNGYETTAAIRDRSSAVRNHLIPVIALTANAFTDDRALCRNAGMNDYLSKPVDFTELLEMIARWSPFDGAQGPPFDGAQGPPFDGAQGPRSGNHGSGSCRGGGNIG